MKLYTGTIRHRRYQRRRSAFTHRVAFAYVDLDRLPPRSGPVTFRATDYLDAGEARERAGTDGPVRLLTTPRVLGLIFNPVSFYYCFAADGRTLAAVLAEVTNTPWGERHVYRAGEGIAKALHVSPLMGMDQTYRFAAPAPGPTLSVHIESTEAGERAFDATLNLRQRPWSTLPLLLALRTLPLIYAHATLVRLKGVPGHPHPEAAA